MEPNPCQFAVSEWGLVAENQAKRAVPARTALWILGRSEALGRDAERLRGAGLRGLCVCKLVKVPR
jgi:hypothetical protein